MSNGDNGINQRMAGMNLSGSGKYVPPHMRDSKKPSETWSSTPGRRDRAPIPNSWSSNSEAGTWGRSNGRFGNREAFDERGSYGGYRNRRDDSQGYWRDGVHHVGACNPRVERDLFGSPEDVDRQQTGINFEKYDDIPVEASGRECPEPVTTFTHPPLDEHLLNNIELARYTTPTPVQKYSIPIVGAGRDLMACAQTGSGKTGGFLFPVLSQLFSEGPRANPSEQQNRPYASRKACPSVLILAPTRELVSQIYDEAKKFAYRSWVRPAVVYGGADIGVQIREIGRGCDLLVATPGRLVDLIERARISLCQIRYLVLDEADRMLDMGFEPQIRRIVEKEDMPGVQDRVTLMFSATFPRDIQELARDFLKDYIFLSVGRVGSTSENITQKVEYVEDEDKRSVLLDILHSTDITGLTLIFVETKRMADSLSNFLLDKNFPATSIHGDRTQRERERALDTFRTGRTPIMVATAVAARGLDIANVAHVVSYDLPTDIDDYVHRIGRTGRAGNTGLATAFFNRNNKNIVNDLLDILKEANQEMPPFLEEISRETRYNSVRGRGRGRGGSFGGRDYRAGRNNYYGSSNNYGGSSGGGGGGYSDYSRPPISAKTSWF